MQDRAADAQDCARVGLDSQKKLEKLDYMHANSVKRKLVEHPKEWPWSSWAFMRTVQE